MALQFKASEIKIDTLWAPFRLGKPDYVRPLGAKEGVSDRLRLVAFAELQARDMFLFGAKRFANEAPQALISQWQRFAEVENRHAQMLLDRMAELGVEPGERVVSDKLSRLCMKANDPSIFLFLLSSAEERGMEAGFILGNQMVPYDAVSAQIFKQIAEEEVEHVETANSAMLGLDMEALRAEARAINQMI